jgi:hypothetical protein
MESVRELIDRINDLRPRDGFIELLMHRSNLSTHVLLEGLGFKTDCCASSLKVVQGAINLCRIKVSVSAILNELARFIANPYQMRIKKEVHRAFREVDGRDRVAFRVREKRSQ